MENAMPKTPVKTEAPTPAKKEEEEAILLRAPERPAPTSRQVQLSREALDTRKRLFKKARTSTVCLSYWTSTRTQTGRPLIFDELS